MEAVVVTMVAMLFVAFRFVSLNGRGRDKRLELAISTNNNAATASSSMIITVNGDGANIATSYNSSSSSFYCYYCQWWQCCDNDIDGLYEGSIA